VIAAAPDGTSSDRDLRRLIETAIKPNLEGLPEQKVDLVIEEVTTMIEMSGPYPPPAIAREYEALCPGFMDRTLTLTERAQAASIAAEQDERNKNQMYRVVGLVLAALILTILIAGGIFIALKANVYVGAFTSLAGVVASAVTLFINGRPLSDGQVGSISIPEASVKPAIAAPKKTRSRGRGKKG
jgi:uncharacterized membrane protein